MNEAKPFASLSSSLLARKGHAKPAMRPQSFHMVPGPAPHSENDFGADHDDLGWNDMGHELNGGTHDLNGHDLNGHDLNGHGLNGAAAPVLPIHPELIAPVEEALPPPVVEQQEMLAREFAAPVQEPAPKVSVAKPRAAPGSRGKAAFTLRLDAERHLRLRLVCAVNHRSAQQIVTLALDEYLARQPDNAALAARSFS